MRSCPTCGFKNLDSRDRCLKCKAALLHDAKIKLPRKSRIPGINLYWRARASALRQGRRVRQLLAVPLPQDLPHRFPLNAAFLGLLPGLGQIYNHQAKKALYFTPVFVAFAVLAAVHITRPYLGNLLFFAAFSTSMFSFYDALITAARINGQFFTMRNKLAAMIMPFFLAGLLLSAIATFSYFDLPLVCLYYMNYDYMKPGLRKGDRVAAEGMSYFFTDPKPGDVVKYKPPQYRAWQGKSYYIIGASSAWGRIMGVGGETLEFKDRVFYIDGRKLSTEYYPLATADLPDNFTIKCPENHYIILISARLEDKGLIASLRSEGGAKAPPLGGKDWEEACVVDAGPKTKHPIYNRTYLIYHPAERRRILQARGERFLE